MNWSQEEQKRAVLDDVEKWRDRLGFLLDYSFWCAVAGGHAGLCKKLSYTGDALVDVEGVEKCENCGGLWHSKMVCASPGGGCIQAKDDAEIIGRWWEDSETFRQLKDDFYQAQREWKSGDKAAANVDSRLKQKWIENVDKCDE